VTRAFEGCRLLAVSPWWREWPDSFQALRGHRRFRYEVFSERSSGDLLTAVRRDEQDGPVRVYARAPGFTLDDWDRVQTPPRHAVESLRRNAWNSTDRLLLLELLGRHGMRP